MSEAETQVEPAAPVAEATSEAHAEAVAAHLELRASELAGFLRAEADKGGDDAKALAKAFSKRLAELL